MKKHIIFAATLLVASVFANAKGVWTLQNSKITVDTLYHATVGPGTTETELRIEGVIDGANVVNNIFYTETDLSNPYVEMRAAKAGNHMRMLETVPDIAKRMNKPSEKYFAGVNADFFNMGYPYNSIGTCISNGFITNYAADGADIDPYYILFDADGVPSVARHVINDWFGEVQFPSGAKCQMLVNTNRGENELLLYTPQWQLYNSYEDKLMQVGRTGTNQYGVEVKVRPVGKNVLYGNSLQLEVISDPEIGVGDMAIPIDGYVLSAHGDARAYLQTLKPGDVVIASIGIKADGQNVKIKELLGGFPIILKNGQIRPAPGYPEHLSGPEPRSAVGYNSDRTILIMLVVDGRNAGGSAGVKQRILGEIMRNVGCADAMNFDGGGSSTMYIDGLGIKNVPSSSSLDKRPEGQPRTVVNALFAVATAPVDNVIASIEIREKKLELNTGDVVSPVVYGYNQYGVMVSTDLSGCTFHLPAEIGTVSGGAVTASSGHYSGMLTAEYNGLTHSIPVIVNGGGEFVAGVDEVEVEDDQSEKEYYLTNGVRVPAPSPNQITIIRQGKNVRKTLNK